MSLIVGIRAAQGLILATDSLTRTGNVTSLDARKLMTLPKQPHVAVAFCGGLALGSRLDYPVADAVDAFAARLPAAPPNILPTRLIAAQLGMHLAEEWQSRRTPADWYPVQVIIAGIDAGMSYGEIYWLQVPDKLAPELQRWEHGPYFHALWGDVHMAQKIANAEARPYGTMPLQEAAALARHVVESMTQPEAWLDMEQNIGGPVRLVTITQAHGAQWLGEKSR